SKSTVSQLCKSLDEVVNSFRDRKLGDTFFPYLMTDATYFKVRENHRIVSKAMMIALGIREDGKKEIVGFCVKDNESVETWTSFMRSLKQRGLQDPYMITSDANKGQLNAIGEIFPAVAWQRCQSHFTRNIMEDIPNQYKKGFSSELREMLTAKNLEAARKIRDRIIEDYQDVAEKAMETLDLGFDDAMTVMALPAKLRTSLRTSNLLERRNGELKRRSNVVKIFPNVASLNRLMGAVLVEMHDEMVMRRAGVNNVNDYGTIPSESKFNLIAIAKTQQLKQTA
ncbi:putative transposase, partial [Clostridiales Family XIII bacterium PM5-7]